MTWIYNGKPFDPDESELESVIGFVYQIEEVDTGMKYIGKKLFWKPKILPITKTRKRRKRTMVQSDWRTYHSSNKLIMEKAKIDPRLFVRTVLKLCSTKGECSYWEAKMQFDNEVLLRDDFYNQIINCRIHAKHINRDIL